LPTFPSFGFLVTAPPDRATAAAEPFLRRGLGCARCGRLNDTGTLTVTASGESADVWRLASEPFTHLTGE
jgi:selenophosphate synthetase-related protein